jgi:hypothetical protein
MRHRALEYRWRNVVIKNAMDRSMTTRQIERPAFETVLQFWTSLLAERGLPQSVRWVFYQDYARQLGRFAFRLRPAAEAERIARFAYEHLDPRNPQVDPKYPLAIVAYAVNDGAVITGLQQDVFTANEDVYREDWNVYFDARDHILENCMIVSDDLTWARLRAEQPFYLSELDYLVSVDALRGKFGYRD